MTVTSDNTSTTAAALTPKQLIATAEDWLKQRGVPFYLGPRENEHRVIHAIACVAIATGFGALLADGRGLPYLAAAALAGDIVLVTLVVSVVLRRNDPDKAYRVMPPGKMNITTAVALLATWVVDSVVAGDIRLEATLLVAAALACLLAFAAATPLGAVRILWWAAGHPFREVRQNVRVLAGALPLLLLTIAFLLLTTELWVVATHLNSAEFVATLGLFVALGLAFLLVLASTRIADAADFADWDEVREFLGDRRPSQADPIDTLEILVNDCLDRAASFEQWDEVRRWLDERPRAHHDGEPEKVGAFDGFLGSVGVPDRWLKVVFRRQRKTRQQLAQLRDSDYWDSLPDVKDVTKLKPRERANTTIVLVFGQGVQVVAVSLLMAAFFLLLGWLTVDEATLLDWGVEAQDGWWLWTGQHLKVAALLAAFAGLSYAVYAALFKEQRELFFCELDRKMTQRLAVRALHRGLGKLP
jgi:hypothetical protein